MKQKINLRLTLISILSVLAAAVSLTFVYYNIFSQQVKKDLKTNTVLLSDTGIFQETYENLTAGEKPAAAALDNLSGNNIRITWVDTDGTVLYDSTADASSLPNHKDRPEISQAFESGTGESIRRSATLNNMNTYYYALLLEDGTVLRTATEARTIVSMFLTSVPLIVLILVLVTAACILIGHLLTLRILKPLNYMAEHLDDHIDTPEYKELIPFADKIRSQHENILAAAKSRQDFTANVSHELKTPLTAISGYAELLENHMIPPENEAHIAHEIRHNADRLLSLINDIIRLSELDHSDTAEDKQHFEIVNLKAVAEECVNALEINAEKKHVTLHFSGANVRLSADKDLLNELTTNLIQNAIQYNNEGGDVWVTVGETDRHACLTVKDNGIGIPKDQQDRVFERFYRVDKSRSRETGGTGLGLAIVKHIAEIHEAKISLESAPGKGTEIRVNF